MQREGGDMAQMIKAVITLLSWCDHTAHDIEVYGPLAEESLVEKFPDSPLFSRPQTRRRHEGLLRLVEAAREALREAESAYVDEQSDDLRLYAARDEARERVQQTIKTWRALARVMDDGEADSLGLGAPFPSEQSEQIAYARNVYTLASQRKHAISQLDHAIDLAPYLASLIEPLDAFEAAFDQLSEEQMQRHLARVRRDEVLERAREGLHVCRHVDLA